MPDEYIFVYGTLRKETATSMYHILARHCEYHSDGCILGRLYEVDGYPGAVESNEPDEKVYGELYKIISRGLVLPKLDEYEECTDDYPQPHEYIRKKLEVFQSGGRSVWAWVYIYNHDVKGLLRIESGDYLSFMKEK